MQYYNNLCNSIIYNNKLQYITKYFFSKIRNIIITYYTYYAVAFMSTCYYHICNYNIRNDFVLYILTLSYYRYYNSIITWYSIYYRCEQHHSMHLIHQIMQHNKLCNRAISTDKIQHIT